MKVIIKTLLIIFGIIFLLLLLAWGYLYSKGFAIVPSLGNMPEQNVSVTETEDDREPLPLTDRQEKTLRTFGIDPAALPTELTDEQIQCITEKIGQERALEILEGDTPTPTEIFQASRCVDW